jgi:integrase/recombinase XerD
MIRIAIIQDTRREKKDNKYPVKLRVTYNREAKYYPTNIDLTKDEFKNVGDKKTIDALLEVKADINEQMQMQLLKHCGPFPLPVLRRNLSITPFQRIY